MTKADKIKEAWIAKIGEEKYNEVKPVIDGNGWLDVEKDIVSFRLYASITLSDDFEEMLNPFKLRPKCLNQNHHFTNP